eukprot:366414-Chlamydomonas_euryale.AAC.2
MRACVCACVRACVWETSVRQTDAGFLGAECVYEGGEDQPVAHTHTHSPWPHLSGFHEAFIGRLFLAILEDGHERIVWVGREAIKVVAPVGLGEVGQRAAPSIPPPPHGSLHSLPTSSPWNRRNLHCVPCLLPPAPLAAPAPFPRLWNGARRGGRVAHRQHVSRSTPPLTARVKRPTPPLTVRVRKHTPPPTVHVNWPTPPPTVCVPYCRVWIMSSYPS